MSRIHVNYLHLSTMETASGVSEGQYVPGVEAVAYLDITDISQNATLDLTFEGQDPLSGNWAVIDSFAQKTTTGTSRLSLPDIPDQVVRISYVIGGSEPSFTFTVSILSVAP